MRGFFGAWPSLSSSSLSRLIGSFLVAIFFVVELEKNVGSLFETVQARWEENRGIADSSARRQPAGVTAAATLFVTRDALDTWPRARRAVIKKGSTSQTACFGNLLT